MTCVDSGLYPECKTLDIQYERLERVRVSPGIPPERGLSCVYYTIFNPLNPQWGVEPSYSRCMSSSSLSLSLSLASSLYRLFVRVLYGYKAEIFLKYNRITEAIRETSAVLARLRH